MNPLNEADGSGCFCDMAGWTNAAGGVGLDGFGEKSNVNPFASGGLLPKEFGGDGVFVCCMPFEDSLPKLKELPPVVDNGFWKSDGVSAIAEEASGLNRGFVGGGDLGTSWSGMAEDQLKAVFSAMTGLFKTWAGFD